MNPLQYAQKAILINEFSGGTGLSEHNSTPFFHPPFKRPFSAYVFIVALLIVTVLSQL